MTERILQDDGPAEPTRWCAIPGCRRAAAVTDGGLQLAYCHRETGVSHFLEVMAETFGEAYIPPRVARLSDDPSLRTVGRGA